MIFGFIFFAGKNVSTHSRLKAAGSLLKDVRNLKKVSTHSRLKAAGCQIRKLLIVLKVSTHSRLKAAGMLHGAFVLIKDCFNTQPPEGGWQNTKIEHIDQTNVSTHSRLKAAGSIPSKSRANPPCFNTQPPEGGWSSHAQNKILDQQFQHTAA